ncbi:MAG: hypothetical protein K0S83_297 [Thermomicrobiales bacterium]|jgi:hypothetical protein|nr:hypothetical protein [Thermomicrobiales bacterium]
MSRYRIVVNGGEIFTDSSPKPSKPGMDSSDGYRALHGIQRGARPELCDGQLLSNNACRLLGMTARGRASD